LESRVCECYAVVKKEMDRLLPQPASTSAKSGLTDSTAARPT